MAQSLSPLSPTTAAALLWTCELWQLFGIHCGVIDCLLKFNVIERPLRDPALCGDRIEGFDVGTNYKVL